MVEYTERLRLAMKRSGLTTQKLADGLGISYQAAKKALDGKTKSLTAANTQRAAKILGVSSTWLAAGEGSMVATVSADFGLTDIGTKRVPLISYVQAGAWRGAAGNCPDPETQFLLTDLSISGDAFAVEIMGDSMAPEFAAGDRVIIDPNINPSPGDYVVATNGDGEATFKKYRQRGINEKGHMVSELIPLNPNYPSIRSDVTPISIVGVLVEHRKYRRRP